MRNNTWKLVTIAGLLIIALIAYGHSGGRESCEKAYPSVYYNFTPPSPGEVEALLPSSANLEELGDAMVSAFNETHNPNYVISLANLSMKEGIASNFSGAFTYLVENGSYSASLGTPNFIPPHFEMISYPKVAEFEAFHAYTLLERGDEKLLVVFYILNSGARAEFTVIYPHNWSLEKSSTPPTWRCGPRIAEDGENVLSCEANENINATPMAYSERESLGFLPEGKVGAFYVLLRGDEGKVELRFEPIQ